MAILDIPSGVVARVQSVLNAVVKPDTRQQLYTNISAFANEQPILAVRLLSFCCSYLSFQDRNANGESNPVGISRNPIRSIPHSPPPLCLLRCRNCRSIPHHRYPILPILDRHCDATPHPHTFYHRIIRDRGLGLGCE